MATNEAHTLWKHNKARLFASLLSGNQQVWYEVRYMALARIARRAGFELYGRNLSWTRDAAFLQAWKKFPEARKIVRDRNFALYNFVQALRAVPGDLAECGVFRGASSYLALAASRNTGKHLHGFDSFQGLSKPETQDEISTGYTFKWEENDLATEENDARANLASFKGQYTFYKGWIPERFAEVADKTFSIVHIDVDLYQPTRDSIEFFYPRLSAGGLAICDDYGFLSCPGARRAMDEFAESQGKSVVHLPTGQGILFRTVDS